MIDRLVSTCLKILTVVPPQGMKVSKVILQTSSDRSHVIEALKTLQKAKLIKEERVPHHKQIRIQKITELGQRFLELGKLVHEYCRCYVELRSIVETKFSFPPNQSKETQITYLRNREWPERYLKSYTKFCDRAYHLLSFLSPPEAVHCLLIGYISIVSRYSRMNNSARLILSNIILVNIDKLLSLIADDSQLRHKTSDINFGKSDEKISSRLDYIANEKQEWMEAISDDYKLFDNVFIRDKAKDMYSLLLSMLNWEAAEPSVGSAN